MKFVRLQLCSYKNYSYQDCSDMEMCNLGSFLAYDAGDRSYSFKKWLFHEPSTSASNNATILEKEEGFISIRDMYDEEEEPTQLKLTYNQFFQILTDWEEKVIKLRPKEVIIKYDNGQFVFETKNE